MKNPLIYLVVFCALILLVTPTFAQNFNPKKNNYLVLTKNIQQLKPILLTAQQLAKEDGKKYGEFYIVICGKTVADLKNTADVNEVLALAKALNVQTFVCGISLKKFDVTADQLPPNLFIVENGILYGFQLQKKGFITLSI